MVNYDLLFAIIFYGILLLIFFRNKERFIVQNKIIAIYKTQLGIKLMDKIAKKFPRILSVLAYFSILLGFIGMIIILYFLIKSSLDLLFVPNAQPAIAPVLPGIKVPGLPSLSFWHWVISIFIVAVVHEFSHGIFARLYRLKVKSSGIAFFGPILAAFVEPDEKDLEKTKKKNQLAILSAGPFSNFVFGILFFLTLTFLIAPINAQIFEPSGIIVNSLTEGMPASKTELKVPFTITKINDFEVKNLNDFIQGFKDFKPQDEVTLTTDQGEYTIQATENPDNKSLGFIGISGFEVKQTNTLESFKFLGKVMQWLTLLFFWLLVVNIGVGLFNLLPLGPIDGGRMFLVLSLIVHKNNKERATKTANFMSLFCLLLLFINLLPWLGKLITFLFKPILFLIALI